MWGRGGYGGEEGEGRVYIIYLYISTCLRQTRHRAPPVRIAHEQLRIGAYTMTHIFIFFCVLCAVCCVLGVVCCLLRVVCCMLCVVYCVLCVVCFVLCVVCCMCVVCVCALCAVCFVLCVGLHLGAFWRHVGASWLQLGHLGSIQGNETTNSHQKRTHSRRSWTILALCWAPKVPTNVFFLIIFWGGGAR